MRYLRGKYLRRVMTAALALMMFGTGAAAAETERISETETEQMTEESSEDLSVSREEVEKIAGDTYNMLLIGVDRRNESWYGNSDVMVLVTVNPEQETIYLTSFMRDLYADIPGIGVSKLNAACASGGADLCVETICDNYGVKIDNYAMVDFNSMAEIVNALGGVEVEITDAEMEFINKNLAYQYDLAGLDQVEYLSCAGDVLLNGYQAVVYTRDRFTGVGSDFGRTERQRKVLKAMLDKIKSMGSVADMARTARVLLTYMSHDLDSGTILKLITKMPSWMEYDIVEQHLPYDDLYYSQNEILTPTDMAATRERLQETLYGEAAGR